METLEFSQEELRYLMFSFNILLQTGKVQTGDILTIAPIIQRIKDKIVFTPEEIAAATPPTNTGNHIVPQDHKKPAVPLEQKN